jgi:DNA-binding NarL/FixJ family response regulator
MTTDQRSATRAGLIRITPISARRLKVLVVDSVPIRRAGITSVLQRAADITVVGESATLADAVKTARRLRPDVIVTNIELPDGRADIAWSSVTRTNDHSRALILADTVDDEAVLTGLAAGVNGYLLHDVSPELLVAAIRLIAARMSVADEAVARSLARSVSSRLSGKTRRLSRQERKVLELVAKGRTNKEIADTLRLSPLTVKNYLASIFQKLHVTRRAEAAALFVQQARRRG